VGCPGGSTEKAEAAAVSRAITSLREADNEKKRELIGALRDTSCSEPDICSVRSRCLAAYELHVEVLTRLGTVMATVGAQGNPGDVEAMKRDLARSRELASACTDAQGEMIRKYKL
jgi:hypothetical protein